MEPRTKKYVQGLLPFGRNLSNKHKKIYWNRTRCSKKSLQKIVHITAEAKEKVMANKIDDKTVKRKPIPYEKSRNVEEISIPPEKREERYFKMERYEISKLLYDLAASKFVKKKIKKKIDRSK